MHKFEAMNSILHDLKLRLLSPIAILSWLSGSIITALVGPFNTYNSDTLDERLLFWGGILFIAFVLSSFVQIVIRQLTPGFSVQLQTCISCALFILLYWGVAYIIVGFVYGPIDQPGPLIILLSIAGTACTIFLMVYLISPQTLARQEPKSTTAPAETKQHLAPQLANSIPTTSPSLKALAPDGSGKIIRLTMRDHYIEVFSDTGNKLVHMRFADALTEVANLNGSQIHRSHWVNYNEIDDVVKENGKVGFRMSDGTVVPIARSHKARLKKQGLI